MSKIKYISHLPLCLFILWSSHSLAQMASASIFPEMKAINPAVISERPNRAFSMSGKIDNSKKEKNLSSSFGAGSSSKEKGTLATYSAFYGGKGKGITVEAFTELSKGALEYSFNLINEEQGESKLDAEATSKFFGIGVGIGRFLGISLARLTIDDEGTFTAEVGSDTYTSISTGETSATRIRGGLKINLGIDLGAYYDQAMYESKTTMTPEDPTMPDGTTKKTEKAVGVGVGLTTKTFHVEGFIEKRLDDETSRGMDAAGNAITTKLSPTRLGGTIEAKVGSLTLGYTGMFYTDGFNDMEREIYDSLIYGTSRTEDRLENTFNFSLGKDKGHIFSGSAFYSKIESEETSRLDSENRFPTETTVMGASVKYSYAF